VAGDQQAALIGQNCLRDGMTKSTYGTGCFLITNTGDTLRESAAQLLGTVAYRLDGKSTYALEGSIFVAGVAIKWLRDKLRVIDDAKETETCATATNGDTQGVYVVPAFTGLGAPHWQPEARGLISGLTLDSSREQIVTATLASVAYQTEALAQALAQDGCTMSELCIDGGMVSNGWLCQFLADIVDVSVERPRVIETTALGAAMLAGVGAGVFDSLAEAGQNCFWGGTKQSPACCCEFNYRALTNAVTNPQREHPKAPYNSPMNAIYHLLKVTVDSGLTKAVLSSVPCNRYLRSGINGRLGLYILVCTSWFVQRLCKQDRRVSKV
jgi:glycerol kinase